MPFHAFIDECGDTGWKTGSSRCLTLAALVYPPDFHPGESLVSVKRRFGLTPTQEIKWAGGKRNHDRRVAVLKAIAEQPVTMYAVTLVKDRIRDGTILKDNPQALYNYPMKLLFEMLNTHAERRSKSEIRLIVDGRNRTLDSSLQSYVTLLRGRGELGYLKPTTDFRDSSQFAGLQYVDHAVGAFHVAYEIRELRFWSIIKPKIVEYKIFPRAD